MFITVNSYAISDNFLFVHIIYQIYSKYYHFAERLHACYSKRDFIEPVSPNELNIRSLKNFTLEQDKRKVIRVAVRIVTGDLEDKFQRPQMMTKAVTLTTFPFQWYGGTVHI